jgi:hypothetical protein
MEVPPLCECPFAFVSDGDKGLKSATTRGGFHATTSEGHLMVHSPYYSAMQHTMDKVNASAPYIVIMHHATNTYTITHSLAQTNRLQHH